MPVNTSSLEPYARRLAQTGLPQRHETQCSPSALRLEHSALGITLILCVDPSSHRIDTAFFKAQDTIAQETATIASALCGILEGLPILEAQNHAVLKLEESLRDSWYRRNVPGIVQTANMSAPFSLMQKMLDDALNAYRIQTGYEGEVSTFFTSADTEWRSQDTEAKLAAITDAVRDFLQQAQADTEPEVVFISDSRIEIDLPNVPADRLPALLFALELHLYSVFAVSIRVVYDNMEVRNKKRT